MYAKIGGDGGSFVVGLHENKTDGTVRPIRRLPWFSSVVPRRGCGVEFTVVDGIGVGSVVSLGGVDLKGVGGDWKDLRVFGNGAPKEVEAAREDVGFGVNVGTMRAGNASDV